jgi:hypothetical protein
VHPDIDEGAERRHIGHRAFQHHPGLQVVEGFDATARRLSRRRRTDLQTAEIFWSPWPPKAYSGAFRTQLPRQPTSSECRELRVPFHA